MRIVEKWRLLPFRVSTAFENMAIDEAVFRESQLVGGPPTLRFFGWCPPAVSIGFFQKLWHDIDVEACRANQIDVVRRITGGKAVLHKEELTYSLVGQEEHRLFPAGIQGRYKVISEALAMGLSFLGIRTEMQHIRINSGDDLHEFCFSTPAQNELLADGRKICGSAQARAHASFLQHGSILINFDPLTAFTLMTRNKKNKQQKIQKLQNSVTGIYLEIEKRPELHEIVEIMAQAFELKFGIQLIKGELSDREKFLKDELLSTKYLSESWNQDGDLYNI